MSRILMLFAPAIGRWLWKKYKGNAAQRHAQNQGLPRDATRPNTSRSHEQVEAMEGEVDVPGGIRP